MKIKKPSVSELLDLLSKPALIGWANKQGLLGIELKEKRRRSLSKGTALHAQIEEFHAHGVILENEEHQQSLERFMQGKRIVSMEAEIETEWFVGRYDVVFEDQHGTWMADYKTGFKGKTYLEQKLQLIAYTMAVPSDKMAIIQIPNFNLFEFYTSDRAPYEEMLKTLSKLYKFKKEIENE